jgi:hypothetical protein
MPDDFDAKSEALLDLLDSLNITISPKIKIADFRAQNKGRAVGKLARGRMTLD